VLRGGHDLCRAITDRGFLRVWAPGLSSSPMFLFSVGMAGTLIEESIGESLERLLTHLPSGAANACLWRDSAGQVSPVTGPGACQGDCRPC